MRIDIDDIRPLLAEHLPKSMIRAIREGDTHDECQDFSTEVLRVLLEQGVDAIMVQSRERDGTPLHHFVLCMTHDHEAVMIDPTISQFHDSDRFKKIFIGSREDLREKLCDSARSMRLFSEYWPEVLHVYEPDGLYEELGVKSPRETPKEAFQEKWSSYGVLQDEHFVDIVSKKGSRKEKATQGESGHSGGSSNKNRDRY